MALSNAERQNRWRKKNRVIYNLRRRNKRKILSSNTGNHDATTPDLINQHTGSMSEGGSGYDYPKRNAEQTSTTVHGSGHNVTGPTAQLSTIDGLRQLVKMVSAEPTMPATKPLIYRDDYGRVITETQWETLQDRKQRAKQGGYEIDEYTQ